MPQRTPPHKKALVEALELSEEILKNIELSEIPLTNIVLKVSRLARILNDFEYQKIMEYEAGGYPSTSNGISHDISKLAALAGREFKEKDDDLDEIKSYVYTEAIEKLEQKLEQFKIALAAARDPDISLSSANPNQHIYSPRGNRTERIVIQNSAEKAQERLAARRSFIYSYVLRHHYELKFSGIADDIFSRIREMSGLLDWKKRSRCSEETNCYL